MWMRNFLRTWLGRRQSPIQTRKKITARRKGKPTLEMLEDRLAPATVSYSSDVLYFVAAAGETITVTAPSNKIQIQLSNTSDTITRGSGATNTNNFALSDGNQTLTISNVTITTFNVDLANQQNTTDTLTFGLGASSGVPNVNIGAGATAGIPQTDTEDTVTLTSTTISGNLNVSAGTIDFQGATSDVAADNVSLSAVNNLTVQTGAVPYVGSATINAASGTGQYGDDQYITGPDWAEYGYVVGDTVAVSGVNDESGSEDFTIAAINGDNLYLIPNAAFSLPTGTDADVTVQKPTSPPSQASQAATFEGNATIINLNVGIIQGLDEFISGPDWASYGFAVGDTVAVSVSGETEDFTITDINSDDLFLDTSSALTPGTANVTVQQQAATFTPQITATDTLTLNLTGAGSAFSGGIQATTLAATTNNGNITMEDISSLSALELQTLNAGTGQIQLERLGHDRVGGKPADGGRQPDRGQRGAVCRRFGQRERQYSRRNFDRPPHDQHRTVNGDDP